MANSNNPYVYYIHPTTTVSSTTTNAWQITTNPPQAAGTIQEFDISAEILTFFEKSLQTKLNRINGSFFEKPPRPKTMKHMWRPRS